MLQEDPEGNGERDLFLFSLVDQRRGDPSGLVFRAEYRRHPVDGCGATSAFGSVVMMVNVQSEGSLPLKTSKSPANAKAASSLLLM